MSFGRKGLAAGQTAPATGGGFGRADPAISARQAPQAIDEDDIAAKRAAFIAAERERRPDAIGEGAMPSPEAMASLHNSKFAGSGPVRPAQPLGAAVAGGAVGETGLPPGQEQQVRAAARAMSSGAPAAPTSYDGALPRSSGSTHGKKFVFGDPLKRNLAVAYILWYFAGVVGLHRVYCGHMESGMYQLGLFVVSIVIGMIFAPLGLIGLLAWICWLVGDLFMIPGLMKKFKAQHSYEPGVFA